MLDLAKKDTTRLSAWRVLPPSETRSSPPAHGYPRVYWLDYRTAAIDWYGKVDEGKGRYALAQLQRLIAERRPQYFFSDTSQATHYVPAVRRSAADILGQLRRAGVVEMAAVLSSPPIRVFTAAIARITGLELKTFELREHAIEVIAARQVYRLGRW